MGASATLFEFSLAFETSPFHCAWALPFVVVECFSKQAAWIEPAICLILITLLHFIFWTLKFGQHNVKNKSLLCLFGSDVRRCIFYQGRDRSL